VVLCFAPYILFRDLYRCLLGKTEKAGRATVFLYWISLFDLTLHMMFFHIAFFLIIKKKNWENLQDIFFSLGLSDNRMYFLLISQFFGY
jgi:hypothetical protein